MTTDTVSVDKADLRKAIKLLFALVATNQEHVNLMNRLNAALKQPAAPDLSMTQRCAHCDDTGDVHSPDGEWRGICICPAGDAIRAAQQPDIRTQACVSESKYGRALSEIEAAESRNLKASDEAYRIVADNIRQQLLQYVPPVGEWPYGHKWFAFKCMDLCGIYFIDEPEAIATQWLHRGALETNIKLPEHLRPHWAESLWNIDDVKAARGLV